MAEFPQDITFTSSRAGYWEQRLTTKKVDGTAISNGARWLLFLNLIPQNWRFKSHLIAFDKNQSPWHFTHEQPYKWRGGSFLIKSIFKQWPFTQASPGLMDITGTGFVAQIYLQMI